MESVIKTELACRDLALKTIHNQIILVGTFFSNLSLSLCLRLSRIAF